MNRIIKLFGFIIGTELIAISIVFYFINKPVNYIHYKGDIFSCKVPKYSKKEIFQRGLWQIYYFLGKGHIYISHKIIESSPYDEINMWENYLKNSIYKKNIKIYEDGMFFLLKGKGKYRRYVYIFTLGNRVFWLENSWRTTERIYKDVLDEILISFKIDNLQKNKNLDGELKIINKEIIKHSQPTILIFLTIVGVMLSIMIVTCVIIIHSGRLPAFFPETPIKKEEFVYTNFRATFANQYSLTAIALFQNSFKIYVFKKPKFIINKGELESINLVKGKKEDFIEVACKKCKVKLFVKSPQLWYSTIEGVLK